MTRSFALLVAFAALAMASATPPAPLTAPKADPAPAAVQVTYAPKKGETLAQFAKRTVGDEAAAPEIKALNALTSDGLAPEMALRVPGPERETAVKAVTALKNAIAQVDLSSEQRQ